MTQPSTEFSPQRYARIGGALYLFVIVAALFGIGQVRMINIAAFRFSTRAVVTVSCTRP